MLGIEVFKKGQNEIWYNTRNTDKKEYTNSNFIPEFSIDTLEEKARIEGPYHELTKGGNLFSAEILKPEANTPENIQNLVDLMDKYNIGYAKVEIKQ